MTSIVAEKIKLKNQPVAILRGETCPENAVQFKPGKWGCAVAMLRAASTGRLAAFSIDTTVCPGGKAGLGFQSFQLGRIEYFLSTGVPGKVKAERYKKTPELAGLYAENAPKIKPPPYLVMKPLDRLEPEETPETVVFLVNADQLSGLVTLANYDQPTQDNVVVKFGAGCMQSLMYPLSENGKCVIGLTDPSARKCMDKDLLSFSIPYDRFLELEQEAKGSFLDTDTWAFIAKRI